jgi:hypothetical protein
MVRQADMGFETPLPGEQSQDILVCGIHFSTDPSGALYWPGQKTLIVADLCLEKGSAKAEKGHLLPPYDTRSTLRRLAALMDRYDPDRVVILGDSFQDQAAAEAMPRTDRNKLSILRQGREWYWVTETFGPDLPDWLGGIVCPVLTLEGIKFRHEPSGSLKSHEISGYLHPAARLTRHGKKVRRKCFVSDGARLVVPAFGVYAGGLNVLDKAIAGLFEDGEFNVWMLGQKKVYPASKGQLLIDTD